MKSIRTRLVVVGVGICTSVATFVGVTASPAAAQPSPVPTIVAPATLGAPGNGSAVITGITVTPNGATSVQVSLSVDHGAMTLASSTGLTFAAGDGTQDPTVTFTGTVADVGAALATVTYTPTAAYTGPDTLSARVTDTGSLYYAPTGHYYQFVSDSINWTDAETAASASTLFGLQGYLATVTSAGENDFIQSKLLADGWIGASDAAVEGEWRWVTGRRPARSSGWARTPGTPSTASTPTGTHLNPTTPLGTRTTPSSIPAGDGTTWRMTIRLPAT